MNSKFLRYPLLISCTLVVSYLFIGTRWISHIKVFGLYFTDLLLASSVIYFLCILFTKKEFSLRKLKILKSKEFLAILIFIIFICLFFLIKKDYSLNSFRDFAPYIYSVVALLSGLSFMNTPLKVHTNTFRVIYFSLFIHAIWVCAQLLNSNLFLPDLKFEISPGVSFFELRPDIDTSLLGLFIALSIYLATKATKYKFLCLSIIISLCTFALFRSDTRGGLIGALSTIGLVFLVLTLKINRHKWKKSFFLFVIIGVMALFSLQTSTASLRAIGTVSGVELSFIPKATSTNTESEEPKNSVVESSYGTTRARIAAWQQILNWSSSHPEILPIGVGFGENYMTYTDAAEALLGQNDPRISEVRSPHNYVVGTFMRLGFVGISFLGLFIVLYFISLFRYFKNKMPESIVLAALLVIPSVALPALVGVVLESPFGAIPFWWALGIIFASSINQQRRSILDETT